jgi:hypothetical protein
VKVALSYILILCFVIIAVPKTVFHHHDEHKIVSEGDLFSVYHVDCFSCDFDYTSLSGSIESPLTTKITFLKEYINSRHLDGYYHYNYLFNSRAPPKIADLFSLA